MARGRQGAHGARRARVATTGRMVGDGSGGSSARAASTATAVGQRRRHARRHLHRGVDGPRRLQLDGRGSHGCGAALLGPQPRGRRSVNARGRRRRAPRRCDGLLPASRRARRRMARLRRMADGCPDRVRAHQPRSRRRCRRGRSGWDDRPASTVAALMAPPCRRAGSRPPRCAGGCTSRDDNGDSHRGQGPGNGGESRPHRRQGLPPRACPSARRRVCLRPRVPDLR